jgi:peptide/nickel transport system substrate-binding protein
MMNHARSLAARGATIAVALCLLLAAAAVTTGAGAVSPAGGVLRVGQDLSGSAVGPVHFDPTEFTVAAGYFSYDWPIYAGLLRLTPDGSLVPDLASKVSVPDPQTIDVDVRAGATFADGTPLYAAAVKAGLERNINTSHRGAFNAALFTISSIDVTGATSLVIHFSQPNASTFYPLLADQESFIVSPKAAAAGDVDHAPVGAGPFQLEKFGAGDQIVLKKNPRYWNAKSIKLSGITFVNVAPGPQQVNALKSNLVDVTTGLAPSTIPAIQSAGTLQVKSAFQDGQFLWLPMCKASGPLANVKVRQALNYAVDRQTINKALLFGKGEPMWGLFPSANALYDKQLTNTYAYNPAKAKKLLKQAGYADGFSASIVPIPMPLTNQVAQVVQDEWKKIGVKITIVPTTDYVNDFYVRKVADVGLIPSTRPGFNKVSGPYEPGSIGNACGYSNPTLHDLITQAQALPPGSAQLKTAWAKIQRFVSDNALSVYLDFTPTVTAATNNVKHLAAVPYIGSIVDYWGVSVSS